MLSSCMFNLCASFGEGKKIIKLFSLAHILYFQWQSLHPKDLRGHCQGKQKIEKAKQLSTQVLATVQAECVLWDSEGAGAGLDLS